MHMLSLVLLQQSKHAHAADMQYADADVRGAYCMRTCRSRYANDMLMRIVCDELVLTKCAYGMAHARVMT